MSDEVTEATAETPVDSPKIVPIKQEKLPGLFVNIDYENGKPREAGPDGKIASNQEVTRSYLTFMVGSAFKELDRKSTKIWGRMQDKLDEAVDSDADFVVFEKAELDFLREVVRDAKYPPGAAKYFLKLDDEITKALA